MELSCTRKYFLPQIQKRLLMNACFLPQLLYCSLIWIKHGRTLNNCINGFHKRALSLVYNDFSSSLSELLEKGKSVTIYYCNLLILAYESFKTKNLTEPQILT